MKKETKQHSMQTFNYKNNDVRTLTKNHETWFVAKDVCTILDISNYRHTIARLDADERESLLVHTLGGQQNMVAVNEAGLYTLLLTSRKPEAKAFKRWVTHEVLPSIRKHGAYMTPEKLQEALCNPDTLYDLATRLKQEYHKRTVLEEKLLEDEPYADFGKSVETSTKSIPIGDFAKLCRNADIPMGRNKLFQWLRQNGYLIYQSSSHNMPKQKYIDQGLFEVSEYVLIRNGNKEVFFKTLITGKGQLYFMKLLKEKICSVLEGA